MRPVINAVDVDVLSRKVGDGAKEPQWDEQPTIAAAADLTTPGIAIRTLKNRTNGLPTA